MSNLCLYSDNVIHDCQNVDIKLVLELYRKTTIVQCLVGLGRLDSGQVLVLGQTPGGKGSSVPGSDIGYMPQEAALYPNLTIGEILSHFGSIYGMSAKEIQERTDFLVHFLKITDTSRLIRCLR